MRSLNLSRFLLGGMVATRLVGDVADTGGAGTIRLETSM